MTSRRHVSKEAETIFKMLKEAKVGMLVTGGEPGSPVRSRPMTFAELDRESLVVRMFGSAHSMKEEDIAKDPRANISFMDVRSQKFVSLSGLVTVSNDDELKKRLWRAIHYAFYPEGVDDPELRVLEFKIAGGDFWDAPGSKVVQLFGIAKAILTNDVYKGGTVGHIGHLH